MLLSADPNVALRVHSPTTPALSDREVWTDVFVEQSNLFSSELTARLSAQAKAVTPKMAAGDVETSDFVFRSKRRGFAEHVAEPEYDLVLEGLFNELLSYGFVTPTQRTDFERNALYMHAQGAAFHVDTFNSAWRNALFWVYVLESGPVDLLFPNIAIRLPLQSGQLVVFDPGEPHGVVQQGAEQYSKASFKSAQSRQTFLTGHIPQSREFFKTLGLCLDKKILSQNMQCIKNPDEVDSKTGRLSLSGQR